MLDAISENLPFLAHSLFVAIQERIISPDDSEMDIPYSEFPIDKCIKATKQNILGIHPTFLFAVHLGNHCFAMYLSKSVDDVKSLHNKLFHMIPNRIFDMTDKMDTDVYDLQTRKTESFSEIRDRTINLPAFICHMKKG